MELRAMGSDLLSKLLPHHRHSPCRPHPPPPYLPFLFRTHHHDIIIIITDDHFPNLKKNGEETEEKEEEEKECGGGREGVKKINNLLQSDNFLIRRVNYAQPSSKRHQM